MLRTLVLAAVAATACSAAFADTFELKVTPQTVAWGNYDANKAPALRIKSGDTVVVHTLLTNNPTGLERNGVKPEDVEATLRDVYANVPQDQRGPGGHILTGPIYV